jgi:YVTN family beta-propeller protein
VPVGSDPRRGNDIAGYRLEDLLGRGGMGAVYRAEDLRLGRKVALKVLAPELAENERFRERFLRESQLAASLDHPHIVPIYAAGEADGQLYLAMRYVEGYDLRQLLAREGPLPPERALRLVEQVGDALDAAHERGLIHRDVKPGNVLIAERAGREHCYLADFGLTKQTTSISGLTGTGELVGTVAYVSPEQIRGEPVDARADVYALACVLYECLAGEAPFARDSEVATLWAHVNEPPPSLSTTRSELGREIDRVLARALAKAPEDRPRTCGELVASARAALGLHGGAPPATKRGLRARRLTLPRGRLRVLAVALAAGLAAAATAAVLLRDQTSPVSVPPNSVAVIDPESNRVVAAIPAGAGAESVAVGLDSVWVANVEERTLSRIDPRERRETRRIALSATPTDVAVGFGAVWVALGVLGDLARLDPQRSVVVKQIDVTARGQRGSAAVDVENGVVWAAFGDSTVARVDGQTNRPLSSDFAGAPFAIAVGEGAAWLTNWPDNNVSRLDGTTGALVKTISVAKGPNDVAVGGGAVWVANEADDRVTRIDPLGSSVGTVVVGDRPWAVAYGADAVWVANRRSGTVSRIDPRSREVTDTIEVGQAPVGIAVGEGFVWVTVQAR